MSTQIKIIIPGEPIAKARARHANRGGFVQTYDPQRVEKESLRLYLKAKGAIMYEAGVPLRCDLTFSMPIPSSMSKKRQREAASGLHHHVKKPDIDNLVKFYLDVANGILFDDDKQIVELVATKRYGDTPSVEILLLALNDAYC
jgi:Holliday junction resolvase RusA-like endonuclease